jgi:hydroxyacylglutathione hydrolase
MGNLSAIIIPVTPLEQNCTVLFDEDTKVGVVVDPGGDVDLIMSAITKTNLTISAIWITHGHLDHAGGAMELKTLLNVSIIGPHKDDEPLMQRIDMQSQSYGLGDAMKNATSDHYLNEGDTVSFGNHIFEIYHTPGHSPGHVVFFNRVAQFIHVGDNLFVGSIGRTDLPGGNQKQLLQSIKDKILPLGDDVGFICGHGPGGRIGEQRKTNPYLI